MNQFLKTISALAIGAGAAYYLDPALGRQRRAQANDKLHSASRTTQDYLTTKRQLATDRARGWVATARSSLGSRRPSDKRLNARLRTRIAQALSYPQAVETEVTDGRAMLRGHVLRTEFDVLIATAETMPGIQGVDNELMLHETAEGVPHFQGAPHRAGRINSYLISEAAAPALAVAGGLGAGYRALYRSRTRRTAPLSLALALLAYGVGNGARRIAQHRRAAAPRSDLTSSSTSPLHMASATTPPAEFSPMMPGAAH